MWSTTRAAPAAAILAVGLLGACGSPPQGGLDDVADRGALIEDRVAALDRSREAGETEAVVSLLGSRLADPEEETGERYDCLRLAAELGVDGRPLVPVLLEVMAEEDATPGLGAALQAGNALSRIAPDDTAVFDAVRAKSMEAGGGLDFLAAAWAEPLVRFGELSRPLVLEWFHSDSGPTRFMAVRAMRHAGAWAHPYLLEALNDPEHHVSTTAIDSLIASGAPEGHVLPTLMERLDSQQRRTALSAVDTLGRLGPAAAVAVPAIRNAQVGGDPYADVVVTHTLFRITGALDDNGVSRVIAALDVPNFPVQLRAAEALKDFGPRAASAVQAIGKLMRRTTMGVRMELCHALGAIGSKDGVPILVGRLRGDYDDDAANYDDVVSYDDIVAAIHALVALDAREAVPDIRAVADSVADDDWEEARRLRRVAERAIEQLGG